MVDITSDVHHSDYERTACIVLTVLTTFFLSLRLYSRLATKQLGWDDGAALFAAVSTPSYYKQGKKRKENENLKTQN